MERLGFWGIIKLTTHIVLSNFKHFLYITLLVALLNALDFIVLGPLSKASVSSTFLMLYKIIASQGRLDPSDLPPPSEQQHHSLSLSLVVLAIFNIVVSSFCIVLVTFSVCRACLNKSLDLKGSLRGVLRSAKNLILTWLVEFAVIIAFTLVAVLVMAIIAAGLFAVNANVVIPMTVMAMGTVGGVIYLAAVAFSLANTVAILEEEKGWEAMRRSMYLIQGSRWVAIELYGCNAVLSLALSLVTVSEEASVVWRWGAGAASVGLQAFIGVCFAASMVVLYMSCKGGHGEPLDTLVAASAQFGPPELAAKYSDLEAAPLTTNKQ